METVAFVITAIETVTGVISGILGALGKLKDAVVKAAQFIWGALEKIGAAFAKIGMVGGVAVTAVGVAFGYLGKSIIEVAGNLEQVKMAMTTMLGSSGAANTFIAKLQQFAAKTPFEFTGLMQSTRQLMAYGFAAGEVLPTLTAIGDATSAMGGSAEKLDRVIVAIGQMRAKSKVTAEEMRQLSEAGIPGWQMLAKAMGKSVPQVMKLSELGKISSDIGIPALLKGMEDRFGGMMAKQAKTLFGLWSNLLDAIGIKMGQIGEAALPGARAFVATITDLFGSIFDAKGTKDTQDWVAGLFKPENVQKFINGVVSVIGIVQGALAGTATYVGAWFDLIKENWQTMLVGMSDVFDRIVNVVRGTVLTIVTTILLAVAAFALLTHNKEMTNKVDGAWAMFQDRKLNPLWKKSNIGGWARENIALYNNNKPSFGLQTADPRIAGWGKQFMELYTKNYNAQNAQTTAAQATANNTGIIAGQLDQIMAKIYGGGTRTRAMAVRYTFGHGRPTISPRVLV